MKKTINFIAALNAYIERYINGEETPYESLLHAAIANGSSPKDANRQARVFALFCSAMKAFTYLIMIAAFVAIMILSILIFG